MPNKNDGVWPIKPTVNVEGSGYQETFFKYMLQGGDLDKDVESLNKRYNAALDKAIETGDVKIEADPDFDPAKLGGAFAQ